MRRAGTDCGAQDGPGRQRPLQRLELVAVEEGGGCIAALLTPSPRASRA
jgi:hypothetical protein